MVNIVFKILGGFLLLISFIMLFQLAEIYFSFESEITRSIYMALKGDEFRIQLGFGILCLILGLLPFVKKKVKSS